MNVKQLNEIPPWEWPQEAADVVLATLTNQNAPAEDRLIASELAGEEVIINEDLATALMKIIQSPKETENLRSRSAISFGPVLEIADYDEFDDPDDPPALSRSFVEKIQQTLHQTFLDPEVPTDVRRSILEASVRFSQDWHVHAVRTAYQSNEAKWRITAVFCMAHIKGFEDEILASVKSEDKDILYEAVIAAGNWELDAAYPKIAKLVVDDRTEKNLRIAAIEAAALIRPYQIEILESLTDSDDEDISEAAMDAMAEAGLAESWDEEDEEDFEDEDLDYEEEDDEDEEDDKK